MNQELGTLDRATLAAWRFVNVAGWTALAFVAATAMHGFLTFWFADRRGLTAAAFNLNMRPGTEEGIDDYIAKFGLRIGLTLLLAFLIGWIVGRRVWRRQPTYAAVAAALYTVYTILVFEWSGSASVTRLFTDGTRRDFARVSNLWLTLVYDLIVASTIVLAAWIARRVAARRPAIPDVSRLAQEVPDDGLPELGR